MKAVLRSTLAAAAVALILAGCQAPTSPDTHPEAASYAMMDDLEPPAELARSSEAASKQTQDPAQPSEPESAAR